MRISLKVVMSVFVTIIILLTALVAYLPLYLSGLDSVESAVDNIRAGIVDRSKTSVNSFFKQGSDAVVAVSTASFHGVIDFEDDFTTRNYTVIAAYLYETYKNMNGTLNNVFVHSSNYWRVLVDSRSDGAGNVSTGVHTVISQLNTTFFQVQFFQEMPNRKTALFKNQAAINFPFTRDALADDERLVMNGGTPKWTGATFSHNDVSVGIAAPVYTNEVPTGVFGVSVLPRDINRFLQSIGLRESARAMVYEPLGSGTLIANSWGQANAIVTGQTALGGNVGLLIPLANLTDDLMNRVIAKYGLHTLVNGSVPLSTTMGTKETDKTYVDIIGVTDDYGLLLRVAIAMPLIDFLDSYYTRRVEVIVILVAAVVVIVAVAVAFAFVMTKPLDRLSIRMEMTASLQDEGEDDSPSVLSEVADMQEAYGNMKSALNKMKSYLPQSVWQGLRGGDDDLDDEGSVSSKSFSQQNSSIHGSRVDDDSVSHTSSRSRRSSKGSRFGAVGTRGGLNLAGAALSKRVTVLAINVSGYHMKASGSGYAVTALQNRLTTKIVAAIRDQKGVVDFFQGDHFVATFNAVSNIVAQQKRATMAGLAIRDALSGDGLTARMGAASSTATVGNMGSDDMKRFNVIGRCYTLAVRLMQLCDTTAGGTLNLLLHQSMVSDVGLEMLLQYVDIIRSSSGSGDIEIVASAEGLKTMRSEEWMYQLRDGTNEDPFAAANQVVEFLLEGNMDEAEKLLAPLQERNTTATAVSSPSHALALASAIINAGGVDAYTKK